MKIFTIILTVLIAMTIATKAQIPNNGFENWITVGSYMEPQGWATANPLSTGGFYPVTQSTDHYPTVVGSFSVKLENDTANSGFGIIMPDTLAGPHPVFSITGHPTSFCGYFKYFPQNNDTMVISISLFQGGIPVGGASLNIDTVVANWTSFILPISGYVAADSGYIMISAYRAGPLPTNVPRGNSVLFVDNLSFDNLINSVPEQTLQNNFFNLYPNPASDIVTLNISTLNNAGLTLNIYNIAGTLIKSETLTQNQRKINIRDLSNGIYMVEIKTKEWTGKQKLIIQR